ncbi:MAG: GTPase HflX [Chloroflexi bacterium]|nr:GTPase HflX [Chloroflexota bacterium]
MSTEQPVEKALLLAVETPQTPRLWSVEDSLDELAQLAGTAGAEVVGRSVQRLSSPNPAHYVGTGKLTELSEEKGILGFTLVVTDDELSPAQQRGLEKALRVKVLDRTALILDIFARRARTHEGRLQVELAQHEYLLPRLAGQWSHLERLGGGIGTRGPGESQLETDRRQIRRHISKLKAEIEEVRQQRSLYRKHRRRSGVPVVALVGYTNAGKSTLLNALTDAGVLSEDMLFATLDPTTRKVVLANKQEILLTDTVGFIQKLPTTLVAAFRATLEELAEAEVLIHIVDITHPNAAEQTQVVLAQLAELGLADKPVVTAFNKVDRFLGDDEALPEGWLKLAAGYPNAVFISAAKRVGLAGLLAKVQDLLAANMVDVVVKLPYGRDVILRQIHQQGSVSEEEYVEDGVVVRGKIPAHLAPVLDQYAVR